VTDILTKEDVRTNGLMPQPRCLRSIRDCMGVSILGLLGHALGHDKLAGDLGHLAKESHLETNMYERLLSPMNHRHRYPDGVQGGKEENRESRRD
jgi:hypothetical protein